MNYISLTNSGIPIQIVVKPGAKLSSTVESLYDVKNLAEALGKIK
jgi:hypothetical protein